MCMRGVSERLKVVSRRRSICKRAFQPRLAVDELLSLTITTTLYRLIESAFQRYGKTCCATG
jgi:hypothetical protein